MKILWKFQFPIFYTFQEISHQRVLRSGQAGSSFSIIQLVLKWSYKFISFFLKVLELFKCLWKNKFIQSISRLISLQEITSITALPISFHNGMDVFLQQWFYTSWAFFVRIFYFWDMVDFVCVRFGPVTIIIKKNMHISI